MDAASWYEGFAKALGTEAPAAADVADILALASVAAHASERTAAPISCWLAAMAGRSPAEALALARQLVEDRGEQT